MDAKLERWVPNQGVAFIGWVQLPGPLPPAVLHWGDRYFVFVGEAIHDQPRDAPLFWLYRERGGGLVKIHHVLAERPASEPR